MPAEWLVFIAGALSLTFVWRRHLIRPRSHGFFRIFAFLAILGLACWNARVWFVDALTPRQILSWILLALSAALAWTGGRTLRRLGQPVGGIEPTTALVTSGIYAHIRHPLYGSLILLAAGAWLKDISGPSTALVALAWGATVATAVAEEGELRAQFGEGYEAYTHRTKRFLPGVW